MWERALTATQGVSVMVCLAFVLGVLVQYRNTQSLPHNQPWRIALGVRCLKKPRIGVISVLGSVHVSTNMWFVLENLWTVFVVLETTTCG